MLEKFGHVAKTRHANVSHVCLQHVLATRYANMLHVYRQHVYMHVICIRHVATTRYANMLYARVQHVCNTLHACRAHVDATRNAKADRSRRQGMDKIGCYVTSYDVKGHLGS